MAFEQNSSSMSAAPKNEMDSEQWILALSLFVTTLLSSKLHRRDCVLTNTTGKDIHYHQFSRLNRNKLHRHDIISYKSMQSMRSSLEDVNSNSVPSSLADDVSKGKLSDKLSDHLHWKKKPNRAREIRAELESAMGSEEWISALSLCKKILDLQAFNFEPLYHFYCGFIHETGCHNYKSADGIIKRCCN